jgi:hypothetical protein
MDYDDITSDEMATAVEPEDQAVALKNTKKTKEDEVANEDLGVLAPDPLQAGIVIR